MVDWLLIDYWVTSTDHSWREQVPKQTKSKWGTVGPNRATTLHCHQKNIENWVGTPNFVVRSVVLWRFLDAFFNFCCLISFLLYFVLVLSCLSRLLLFVGLCVDESLVDGCVLLCHWLMGCVLLSHWLMGCVLLCHWLVGCVLMRYWLMNCVVLSYWLLACALLSHWLMGCVLLGDWSMGCVVLSLWLMGCV